MILSRRLRIAPLLFAFLLLALPLAAGAYEHRPREVGQLRSGIAGLLSEAWALVSRIWEKEGGSSDPFGNPKPGIVQPPSDSSSAFSDPPASGK